MNKIEKLIQELCPEGVPIKSLRDVCSDFLVPMRDRPKVFDGDIPWCRIEDIRGHTLSTSHLGLFVSEKIIKSMNLKVFPEGTVVASCSASLGTYAIARGPLVTNQTFIGLVCGPDLVNKYLIYFLEISTERLAAAANSGTIPYISRKKFEDLTIPLPPVEVQREIVSILDTFTELEEELAAELEARQVQYEALRKECFQFENEGAGNPFRSLVSTLCPSGVEVRELGDCLTENFGGGTPSRSREDFWRGEIPWASVGDITNSSVSISGTRQSITELGLQSSSTKLVPAGHVIVAVKINPGAMRVVKSEMAINQDIRGLLLKEELDPYYLTYFFKTVKISSNGTIVQGITNSTLRKVKVPVPPTEIQMRIVELLDGLSDLVTDLNSGLPAEIQARRKQYEYYRNKLLTFKELDAA